jgi:hypothetical protein
LTSSCRCSRRFRRSQAKYFTVAVSIAIEAGVPSVMYLTMIVSIGDHLNLCCTHFTNPKLATPLLFEIQQKCRYSDMILNRFEIIHNNHLLPLNWPAIYRVYKLNNFGGVKWGWYLTHSVERSCTLTSSCYISGVYPSPIIISPFPNAPANLRGRNDSSRRCTIRVRTTKFSHGSTKHRTFCIPITRYCSWSSIYLRDTIDCTQHN